MKLRATFALALFVTILSPSWTLARGGGASFFPGAVAATTTGARASTPAAPDDIRLDPKASVISTPALAALVHANTPMILVDARDPRWDDGHRIAGAVALNIKDSDRMVQRQLPSKQRLIVVYCGDLACPASQDMAERLCDMGYCNVIEYPYGIDGWRKAKLPTTRVRRKR